jgi:hypothetical protein
MAIMFTMLTTIFGASMLPALLAVLFGMVIIEAGNTFITPKLMLTVEEFHANKKDEIITRALARQKQQDVVEEEYVKGINY